MAARKIKRKMRRGTGKSDAVHDALLLLTDPCNGGRTAAPSADAMGRVTGIAGYGV
jgi:hypothetical protein